MIVKKTWERLTASRWSARQWSFDGNGDVLPQYLDIHTGWFLFGILPLYITRNRNPISELRNRV
ncbi:hypothetical protein [Pseudophaeobacter sp.]|jgi:hypothetical protein|uniref:hypothetical protein n=1 Tax=Pseudophaeobacter sp. TaxID=1971739 RepID=UPI003267EB69